jgi:protein-tyrosine phosphatase
VSQTPAGVQPADACPADAAAAAGAGAAGTSADDARRRIPVPGCPNLRDIGGYPAADGRTTRWRTLLRSGALYPAGPDGADLLAGYGLRTVIDLRSPNEAGRAPSPPGIAARTELISLLDSGARGLPPRLAPVYRYLIEQRGDVIGSAVGLLAGATGTPALIHCSAGKDRTGLVVGLVLAALGVPDEIIAADYGLSAGYLGARSVAVIGQVKDSTSLDGDSDSDAAAAELLSSPPGLMLDVLAWARAAAGSIDSYLLAHGLTPPGLAALRANLTD